MKRVLPYLLIFLAVGITIKYCGGTVPEAVLFTVSSAVLCALVSRRAFWLPAAVLAGFLITPPIQPDQNRILIGEAGAAGKIYRQRLLLLRFRPQNTVFTISLYQRALRCPTAEK